MTDVYKQLPRLSWRGIVVPVASRSATFSHDNVSHKFVYRDNELVEALGARNWTFSYTIPMREDIVRGPYLNLFTRTMPEFILACRDRTPGDLEDPVLGVFRARCTSLAGTSDVTRRDGDDLQVEFIHAPEIDDIDLLSGGAQDVRGAAEDARSLDDAVAAVDWEQEVPPEPTVNPLDAIDGVGRQIERIGNKVTAKLDDTIFRLEKLEKTIDRLSNPKVWPIRRTARRLRDTTERLKSKYQDPLRRLRVVTAAFTEAASSFGARYSMSVQDLLSMNPAIAREGLVKEGSRVRVFAQSDR